MGLVAHAGAGGAARVGDAIAGDRSATRDTMGGMARAASPSRSRSGRQTGRKRRPTARSARARREHRNRVRRRWGVGLAVAGVLVPALALGTVAVVQLTAPDECTVALGSFTDEQLDNAEVIVAAGRDAGASGRDRTIAVMTALGESSLRNLDHGDWETSGVTNPDGSPTTSVGLFQQQEGWGSLEKRMDPYASARLFYRAMERRVPEREGLEPTLVAHRTQINRDPRHYAPYWDDARRIVTGLDAGCR